MDSKVKDGAARLMAVLALLVSIGVGMVVLAGGNEPVDLATYSPSFPAGVIITGAGATPGIKLNANATGVPAIRILASGTEVARVLQNGFIVGPGVGTATPTPTP